MKKTAYHPKLHIHPLSLLLLCHLPAPATPTCDPCIGTSSSTFKVKPNTNCVEYVQCIDGLNMGDFTCNGDTVFDESAQYCNWPGQATCVEASCPPTLMPVTMSPTVAATTTADTTANTTTTGAGEGGTVDPNNGGAASSETISSTTLLDESSDCPNPCPASHTGFQTRPGTQCKKYVQCENGLVTGELECFGDTLFNILGQYCDFPGSTSCSLTECPPQGPPPTDPPSGSPSSILSWNPSFGPSAVVVVIDTEESGGENVGNADNATSVGDGEDEGDDEREVETFEYTEITIPVEEESPDCPNPCPFDYTGLNTRPGTLCKQYVQCNKGKIISDFQCYGDAIFDATKGYCEPDSSSWNPSSPTCGPTPCPPPAPTAMPSAEPSISFIPTVNVTSPGNDSNTGGGSPTFPRITPYPTMAPLSFATFSPITPAPVTSEPTIAPTAVYPNFQYYVSERTDLFNDQVLITKNGDPSKEYTMEDFIKSLDVVVYQLPPSKAFFVGQQSWDTATNSESDSQTTTVSGMQYGLINLSAFLANAMVEGIRIDSCDEFNEDDIDGSGERYALSNACGQFGREYENEICEGAIESFHCLLDLNMEITAGNNGGVENGGIPPFMCKPKDGFVGFYDAVIKEVDDSVFSNSYGRTDVEGCCWWGRGVLLTKGRCTIGRMNHYLGERATDAGFFSRYPNIDLCSTPNAICDDAAKSRELRWVLGLFEWADRVQSYNDETTKWNYMEQLKQFYDGGMAGDDFIDGVTNIFTRGCHDGKCANNDILYQTERRDNFKKLIFEIFNLPLTRRPTPLPTNMPTTAEPTEPVPTSEEFVLSQKPTRKNKGFVDGEKEVLTSIESGAFVMGSSSYLFQVAIALTLALFIYQ